MSAETPAAGPAAPASQRSVHRHTGKKFCSEQGFREFRQRASPHRPTRPRDQCPVSRRTSRSPPSPGTPPHPGRVDGSRPAHGSRRGAPRAPPLPERTLARAKDDPRVEDGPIPRTPSAFIPPGRSAREPIWNDEPAAARRRPAGRRGRGHRARRPGRRRRRRDRAARRHLVPRPRLRLRQRLRHQPARDGRGRPPVRRGRRHGEGRHPEGGPGDARPRPRRGQPPRRRVLGRRHAGHPRRRRRAHHQPGDRRGRHEHGAQRHGASGRSRRRPTRCRSTARRRTRTATRCRSPSSSSGIVAPTTLFLKNAPADPPRHERGGLGRHAQLRRRRLDQLDGDLHEPRPRRRGPRPRRRVARHVDRPRAPVDRVDDLRERRRRRRRVRPRRAPRRSRSSRRPRAARPSRRATPDLTRRREPKLRHTELDRVDRQRRRDGLRRLPRRRRDRDRPERRRLAGPPTTYTDKNVPAGTYTYTVDAGDAVGNRSGTSNAVTASTSINPAARRRTTRPSRPTA